MSQTTGSISIRELTAAVQKGVSAASQKHAELKNFKVSEISYFPYLIIGIPPPPELKLAQLADLQAFASTVATHIEQAVPQLAAGGAASSAGSAAGGAAVHPTAAVYSRGGHIICGVFPPPEAFPSLRE